MSITRIQNANALTGTIPADNFANATLDNVTSLPNASLGDMVFISSATASSSASIEFTLGDYKEYKFFFVNIHPQTDNKNFTFQTSTDNGSTYGVTATTTYFQSYHREDGGVSGLGYNTVNDAAQSTNFLDLIAQVGNANDECCSGYLHLFNPSSTVFVKHFISRMSMVAYNDYNFNVHTAGYFNDTNDLTNIKFQQSSGNIDDGKILMFGLN